LNKERVFNDPEHWIRVEGAITPIVGCSLFAAAQEIVKLRCRRPSQDERLAPLRRLLKKHGFLSRQLIDEAPGVPCAGSYQQWYGGLMQTYKLIGYAGLRPYRRRAGPLRSSHAASRKLSNEQLIHLLRLPLHKHGRLTRKIVDETKGIPSAATYCTRFGSMERAYQLAGYLSDQHFLDMLRRLAGDRGYLSRSVIDSTPGIPHSGTYVLRFGSMARVYELIGYVPADHKKPRRKDRQRTCRKYSERDMLKSLRRLRRQYGRLTTAIIVKAEDGPCYTTLRKHFGSLNRAFELIGHKAERRASVRSIPRRWRRTSDGGTVVRDDP
jgi:hypothetical protein